MRQVPQSEFSPGIKLLGDETCMATTVTSVVATGAAICVVFYILPVSIGVRVWDVSWDELRHDDWKKVAGSG